MSRSIVVAFAIVGLGCTGPKGDAGPAGPAGPSGPAGSMGAQGSTGSVGAMGAQGSMGAAGMQGAPGVDGMTGPQGAPGVDGPPGPQGIQGAPGDAGPPGPPGPAGADGQLRIYGDGSAGSVTISTNTNWTTTPPNPAFNYQFADLTIANGATLIVPSGIVIRVTGTFTNNGNISVPVYGLGSFARISSTNSAEALQSRPTKGIGQSAAGPGERTVGGNDVLGGAGGVGLGSLAIAANLLKPGLEGGGSGAASLGGAQGDQPGTGSPGGGTLTVLAQGAISNTGVIVATGNGAQAPCQGGGGGGVVILASRTSVANTGLIAVNGGGGGSSSVSCGAGGGGGGGLIQLIAPTATSAGMFAVGVGGGAAGTAGASGSVTGNNMRMGGGGGGAAFGNGGQGGGISGTDPQLPAGAGGAGVALIRTGLDPTSLF